MKSEDISVPKHPNKVDPVGDTPNGLPEMHIDVDKLLGDLEKRGLIPPAEAPPDAEKAGL